MYPPDPGRILNAPQGPSRRLMAGAVAISLLVPLVIVIALAGGSLFRNPGSSDRGILGLTAADLGHGSWLINITRGSVGEDDATLVISDPSTGATVYSGRVSDMYYQVGDYYDYNDNGMLDAGDTIYLSQTGIAQAGMKIQIKQRENVLGTISELPEPWSASGLSLGLTVNKNAMGDWLISITSSQGALFAQYVTLRVSNAVTGVLVLDNTLNELNATAAVFNDNNADGKLTAGDTVLLKDTSTVNAGMKVQFLEGDVVIASIKELPP